MAFLEFLVQGAVFRFSRIWMVCSRLSGILGLENSGLDLSGYRLCIVSMRWGKLGSSFIYLFFSTVCVACVPFQQMFLILGGIEMNRTSSKYQPDVDNGGGGAPLRLRKHLCLTPTSLALILPRCSSSYNSRVSRLIALKKKANKLRETTEQSEKKNRNVFFFSRTPQRTAGY